MKIRQGFVSNSSSSSFMFLGWGDVSVSLEEKCQILWEMSPWFKERLIEDGYPEPEHLTEEQWDELECNIEDSFHDEGFAMSEPDLVGIAMRGSYDGCDCIGTIADYVTSVQKAAEEAQRVGEILGREDEPQLWAGVTYC